MMQEQLDEIEHTLADVGGFLLFLQQQYILPARYYARAEQHEENIGEALRALLKVKEQLGLPVAPQEEERKVA